jgi:hypothetical protein
MKYRQPYGVSDPNAPYVDRNTPGAISGSRPPGKAIEHPQREIVNVIVNAGLTPNGDSVTQLDEAINLKIAQATGGGDSPIDDLLAILRARNPVYPEVVSADGTFNLSIPATGTIRIPVGINIVHRGCFVDVTEQQDLSTVANKTYHLRKNWTSGWSLKDLADGGYNPSALVEADASFDTSFDDMLTHLVTTNGANVATIKALRNKNSLSFTEKQVKNDNIIASGSPGYAYSRNMAHEFNFARRPRHFSIMASLGATSTTGGTGLDGIANLVRDAVITRYGLTYGIHSDFAGAISGPYVETTISVMG